MSGIVRGWTDDFELPLVIIKRPHTPAEVPVAVVPLDDATLKDALVVFEKATTRLDILRGRMESCDLNRTNGHPDQPSHELSRFEIAAWIDEQTTALSTLRAALGLEGGA